MTAPAHSRTYSTAEVARECKVTERQLQWWDESRLVRPAQVGHVLRWTDEDVARVRLIAEMRRRRLAPRTIARMLQKIDPMLPGWLLIESHKARYCQDQETVLRTAAAIPNPFMLIEVQP